MNSSTLLFFKSSNIAAFKTEFELATTD